jgi:hypothetical protein
MLQLTEIGCTETPSLQIKMATLLNDAATQLSNLDPKSWKTWAGAFATYYIGR